MIEIVIEIEIGTGAFKACKSMRNVEALMPELRL
jgi:hypothetical protein